MENEIILQKLNRIEKYIFGLKEILNIEELSEYTGFSRSSPLKHCRIEDHQLELSEIVSDWIAALK